MYLLMLGRGGGGSGTRNTEFETGTDTAGDMHMAKHKTRYRACLVAFQFLTAGPVWLQPTSFIALEKTVELQMQSLHLTSLNWVLIPSRSFLVIKCSPIE